MMNPFLAIVRFALLPILLGLTSACNQIDNDDQKPSLSLQQIIESGKLVVLSRNAPTSIYVDRYGKNAGPEYDLVEAFAASLKLKVEYKIKPSIKEIIAG
ncbi:MAG: membrane-bound lytic murein transglycosylase F, partial [Planctomycetota bacterium]